MASVTLVYAVEYGELGAGWGGVGWAFRCLRVC